VTLSIRWTDRKRLAVGALGVAYALAALAVARVPGATSYSGRSGATAALVVVTGLSLIIGGLVAMSVEPIRRLGELAVLAGFTWFGPVWEGWHDGPRMVRSLGMLVSAFTLALLAHLILSYPTGVAKRWFDRALVSAVYLEAALVAVGLALFRDPFFDVDCWANCTDNVFLVWSVPGLARAIVHADRWFTVAVATAVIVSVAWRLARGSGPAARALVPIVAPTVMLAGAIWGRAVALQRTPVEDPTDPVFFATFVLGATGVILLALAVVQAAARSRLQHRAVARIVTDLREVPAPASVEAALARAVGDPELRIAYWMPASGRFVDASGATVAEPAESPGRSMTTFVREDHRVAVVSHLATLPDLQRELGSAVRLGLENERLQAEALAHLAELRASRARIVETGDAERRRLERDLHDGAQQRLLALSYDIRLALTAAEEEGDTQAASLLREARSVARGAGRAPRARARDLSGDPGRGGARSGARHPGGRGTDPRGGRRPRPGPLLTRRGGRRLSGRRRGDPRRRRAEGHLGDDLGIARGWVARHHRRGRRLGTNGIPRGAGGSVRRGGR